MDEEKIKGSVTIKIAADGTATLIPPVGQLDRNIQWMQWSLDAPAGWKFAPEPIVFLPASELPPGYSVWSPPGSAVTLEDDWQARAKANLKVNHGDPPVKYRYDIFVLDPNGHSHRIGAVHPVTLEKIDPDMENHPQP